MSFLESTRSQAIKDKSFVDLRLSVDHDTSRIAQSSFEVTDNRREQGDKTTQDDAMDDLTLATDSQEVGNTTVKVENHGEQFDVIAKKVDGVIQELHQTYREIGFSTEEISEKKSKIFDSIHKTLSTFTEDLQRERNNIENECEWLRQQIKIILAMINDSNGERNLSILNRGVLFKDKKMVSLGYNNEMLTCISLGTGNRDSFYDNSPFNIADNTDDSDMSFQSHVDLTSDKVPEMNLVQLKSKLNGMFIDVLQVFVGSFKRLNELDLSYLDLVDILGHHESSNGNDSILNCLPSRNEAEYQRELITQFEIVTKHLKLNPKAKDRKLEIQQHDSLEFIVSSPQKNKEREGVVRKIAERTHDIPVLNSENAMNYLKELNYEILRVIRGLKLTKLSPETLNTIQSEINFCETELLKREQLMEEEIRHSIELIEVLHLNNEQLLRLQKQYHIFKGDETVNDNLLDVETLKFIQLSPRDFGLTDSHISLISKFSNILQGLKNSKQRKRSHYYEKCQDLWAKFHEDPAYVENFVKMNSALTDFSIMNFKMELNRLYIKRSEYVERFITDARLEIEKLWDLMYYSVEQRAKFKYYNYDINNDTVDKETVLNEHEVELEEIKKLYQTRGNVYSLYGQLNDLVKDKLFLQNSSKDSSRLLSKNSCKILLNEEKLRKKIEKNMPRTIESLIFELNAVNEQQSIEGKPPLTINGEDFLERVLAIEEENSNRRPAKGIKSSQASPQKARTKSNAHSPIRSENRSPQRNDGASALTSKKGMISKESPSSNIPNTMKKQLSQRVPYKLQKPKLKKSATGNKLTAALSSSLSGESFDSSSSISPLSKSNSSSVNLHKAPQLRPLNSPLIENSIDVENSHWTNHSLVLSNLKSSPLRANDNIINTSRSDTKMTTPGKIATRENSLKFEFSPVPLQKFIYQGEDDSVLSKLSSITCDTSTIVGDDYEVWREEKIKELNNP